MSLIKEIILFNFGKISSVDEAKKILTYIGSGFYFLGIITLILPFFMGRPSDSLDGIIFLTIGYMLQAHQSRMASIIAIVLSTIIIIETFYNKFLGGYGGKNIILAVIILVYSIRAFRVSFAYHNFVKSKMIIKNFIIKTIVGLICGTVFISSFYGISIFVPNLIYLGDEVTVSILIFLFILGMFFSCNGWLSFTKDKHICVKKIDEKTSDNKT